MLNSLKEHRQGGRVYSGILCFLLLATPFFANGASIKLKSEGVQGDGLLKLSVVASTEQKNPFNAASALISYPQELLELVEIKTINSIFSLWSKKPEALGGAVLFSGGTPAKGGFIFDGNLFTMHMKIKGEGEGKISISDAELLASDGAGTNILTSVEDYAFRIEPAISLAFDTNNDGVVSIIELSVGLAG